MTDYICLIIITTFTPQVSQERTYQEFIANKFKEKISEMEQYYDQMIAKAQAELLCILHALLIIIIQLSSQYYSIY